MHHQQSAFFIECQIRFEYGHRLLSYNGKCHHLHGHSGVAIITLESESLDANSFVVDLGLVKSLARLWIDNHWDHALLLNRKDPLVEALVCIGEAKRIYLMEHDPTAERMAEALYHALFPQIPQLRSVMIRETATGMAGYTRDGNGE